MTRYIKNVFIIFAILLIFLIIAIVIINNNTSYTKQERLTYINSDEWNDEIYPEEMPALFRIYNGNLIAKVIGKSIYYFTTDTIPKYYNDLRNVTEDEIKSYYIDNRKMISLETGAEDFQDFNSIVKIITKLKTQDLILNSFRIDNEKTRDRGNYTQTVLYIKYEDNEEIGFDVKINNDTLENTNPVSYSGM